MTRLPSPSGPGTPVPGGALPLAAPVGLPAEALSTTDPLEILACLLATGSTVVDACDQIATFDPLGANAALQVALKGWEGPSLDLSNRPWVKDLPTNIMTWGDVYLRGTSLEKLPEGLHIRGQLYIGGPMWDGFVPASAYPNMELKTDKYQKPISLRYWRIDYPNGEPTPKSIANRVTALVAIGLTPWDAKLSLLEGGSDVQTFPEFAGLPKSFLAPGALNHPGKAMTAFHGIAQCDPVGANAALNAYLEGRTVTDVIDFRRKPWITSLPANMTLSYFNVGETALTSLPPGLKVKGAVDLMYAPFATLPEGLEIEGHLDLCKSQIQTLPRDLKVGNDLALCGCYNWDGLIPPDAQIGEKVVTDDHPLGVTLEEWRSLHP